jgi:hypothetical protein
MQGQLRTWLEVGQAERLPLLHRPLVAASSSGAVPLGHARPAPSHRACAALLASPPPGGWATRCGALPLEACTAQPCCVG